MATTYEPIATTTLSSTVSTVTFNSIPSTYTDLRLVAVVNAATGTNIAIGYNNEAVNSNTNYSSTDIEANGSAVGSYRYTNRGPGAAYLTNNYTAGVSGIPWLCTFDIFSYASTSVYKTYLASLAADTNGSGVDIQQVCLYRNTNAITAITLYATNMVAGSTLTLYGIKAA